MKQFENKIAFALAALLSSGAVQAGTQVSDLLEYTTMGL